MIVNIEPLTEVFSVGQEKGWDGSEYASPQRPDDRLMTIMSVGAVRSHGLQINRRLGNKGSRGFRNSMVYKASEGLLGIGSVRKGRTENEKLTSPDRSEIFPLLGQQADQVSLFLDRTWLHTGYTEGSASSWSHVEIVIGRQN